MTRPVALLADAGAPAALLAYLVAIAVAAVLGGAAPVLLSLGHRRMQVLLSLTGGVMLGVGLLHLLPHGHGLLGGDIETTMPWVLGGFLAMFLLERAFHGHAHHATDGSHDAECEHHEAHSHSPSGGVPYCPSLNRYSTPLTYSCLCAWIAAIPRRPGIDSP